jgi:uncharacterized protein YecE (DUF72 family)
MSVRFGTCSWKFPSWVGLVYGQEYRYAAEYLSEYARHYETAEIDSWFYHLPSRQEAEQYHKVVPDTFRFTCKVPRDLTLTHLREGWGNPGGHGRGPDGRGRDSGGSGREAGGIGKKTDSRGRKPAGGGKKTGGSEKKNDSRGTETAGGGLEPNETFLSMPLFEQFLEAIEPLHGQLDAIMFQFEYLNKKKMGSAAEFMDKFGSFVEQLPPVLPIALEIRNGNFYGEDYFRFLQAAGIIPVLVEKQYMPPVTSVYEKYGELFGDRLVLRLMGGDRKEIEELSGGRWDRVLLEKPELPDIAGMIGDLAEDREMTVNVNNHFEGSAPRTIARLRELLDNRGR